MRGGCGGWRRDVAKPKLGFEVGDQGRNVTFLNDSRRLPSQ